MPTGDVTGLVGMRAEGSTIDMRGGVPQVLSHENADMIAVTSLPTNVDPKILDNFRILLHDIVTARESKDLSQDVVDALEKEKDYIINRLNADNGKTTYADLIEGLGNQYPDSARVTVSIHLAALATRVDS